MLGKGGRSMDCITTDLTTWVTVILFFLAFNPVCIGLVISFAYTYVEGLLRDMADVTKKIPCLSCEARRATQDIRVFCYITNILIYGAGIFWVFSFGLGIAFLAPLVYADRGVNVSWIGHYYDAVIALWIVATVAVALACIQLRHADLPRSEATMVAAVALACIQLRHADSKDLEVPRSVFVFGLVCTLLQILVPPYLRFSHTNGQQQAAETLIILLVISQLYLFLWFVAALYWHPSTSLARLRAIGSAAG